MIKSKRKIKNCYREEGRFTAEYHRELRQEARARADRWTAKRNGRCPYEAFIGTAVLLALFFYTLGKLGGAF